MPPRTPIPVLADLDLTVRTERLELVPLSARHVPDLWPVVSRPDFPRFMSWQAHTDVAQTESYVRYMVEARAAGTELGWAIVHEGRAVGNIGLDGITWQMRALRVDRAEMGYWMTPALWGRGLMTEAALAAMGFAFETLGLNKLIIGCIEENVASRRVIEKVGFRFLARLEDDVWREGRWWNQLRYELTAREWDAR